jgi:hypothetical protein
VAQPPHGNRLLATIKSSAPVTDSASRRITATALIALTALTAALTAFDMQTTLRLFLTVAFVAVAPGWAAVDYLRISPASLTWITAVASGISLVILIAQVMVWTRWWHPAGALLTLCGLTLAALLHHLVRPNERPNIAVRLSSRKDPR